MRKSPVTSIFALLLSGALISVGTIRAAAGQESISAASTATPAPAWPEAPPKPPLLVYLSPEESVKLVQLPPGYHLELVLSEPVIREPVVSVFDGNGRLYVAEMRTYMQDADATHEKEATSRVSLHWSSKGDGVYDKHSVFVDNLVLPRMILPLKDSVLIQETFTGDVYEYRDTNHDGVADEKKLFYKFDLPRDNNMEHQPSGLVWLQDNWIYTTYNALRIRWTPQGAISEPTAPNGGQWGLTQDNYGKTWFSNAGSDRGPLNFQQPIVYGAFRIADEEATGYREVFPLVGLHDVQAGTRYVRPEDGTLNHTTSAAGLDIYRGDRLPADLVGDLLYGEPVGRLVRRTKVEVRDGITYLSNPYQGEKSEFIRSRDPFFRPVNVVTAPDGTVFITDMYRGIIQQGNWTRKGSYLRGMIDRYGMDKMIGRGRIWRLVHDDFKPGPQPHMLDETPAQLVAHLGHPNGWWRDMAQKLLVLAQDKSVVPALQSLARSSTNALARIHALWTLEGLDSLDAGLVREKLKDSDAHVRVAAIRASETLFKRGDAALKSDILALSKDADPNVGLQSMLTSNLLKWPEAAAMISKTAMNNPVAGVKEIAIQILNPIGGTIGAQFAGPQRQQLEKGQTIFLQLCFACHGLDGKGTPMDGKSGTLAPPLAGSATATGHRDAIIMALLHGVSGPINGTTYEAQMIPMGGNDDAWIAAVASYVRTSFGNQSPLITTEDVERVRAANPDRKDPWTIETLNARLPQPLANRSAWKLTTNRPIQKAGDGAATAIGPATFSFTVTAPVADAWLQIELPEAATISEMRLSSANSPKNFTRSYKIELSSDGENWGEPVATGRGIGPIVDVSFIATKAKWIRITHTRLPFGRSGPGRASGAAANAANVSTTPAMTDPAGAGTGGATTAPPFGGPPQSSWTLDDVLLYQPASAVAPTATTTSTSP